MKGFLEQYGVAIFTIILIAILIAFANPLGIRIKDAINNQVKNVDQIGSNQMSDKTEEDTKDEDDDKDVESMNSVYAVLCSDGELQISGTPIELTNGKTKDGKSVSNNYGEVKLSTNSSPSWINNNSYNSSIISVNILNKIKPTSCYRWFLNCTNLTEIKNISNLNTSSCTTMNNMFDCCRSLTTLDVSNFDTSNVTNMYHMFYDCTKLTTLDVSNFDTSNVTDMTSMFDSCRSLTTLDVSNFDTSNVTDMNAMFHNCSKLTTLDLSNFDTSKVTNMTSMFYGCSSLTELKVSQSTKKKMNTLGNTFVSSTTKITIVNN